jgi:hypothetical protein
MKDCAKEKKGVNYNVTTEAEPICTCERHLPLYLNIAAYDMVEVGHHSKGKKEIALKPFLSSLPQFYTVFFGQSSSSIIYI